MPGAARLRSISVGHSPKPLLGASGYSVLINKKPAGLVGDFYNVHRLGKHYHPYYIVSGSPRVIVQSRPLAKIGSGCSCGVRVGTGSCDVMVN